MTYATERAVFFNPKEVTVGRCLRCASPTDRRSPRTIAARGPSPFGTIRIVRMHHVLELCSRCDRRWSIAAALGLALVFSPAWIIPAVFGIAGGVTIASTKVAMIGFGLSIVVAVASYIWARTYFIQVRSIDDDGLIGLGNVHPEVRDAIVAIGERAQ